MNEKLSQLAQEVGISEEYLRGTKQWNLIEQLFIRLVQESADQCDLLLDHNINSDWARGTHACASHLRKYWGLTQ